MPCLSILGGGGEAHLSAMEVMLDLPPLNVFIRGEAAQTTHHLKGVRDVGQAQPLKGTGLSWKWRWHGTRS